MTNTRTDRAPVMRLPAAIASLPTFLVWRAKPRAGRPGKIDKVPFYTNGLLRGGQQGTPDDIAALVPFATALAASKGVGPDGGKFSGVGMALTAHHDFAAIDFDDCVEGGQIHPEVAAAIFGTYSEISPSGRGIRAIVAGKLPVECQNRKSLAVGTYGIESFSTTGFVTVTGHVTDVCDFGPFHDVIAPPNEYLLALMRGRFGRGRDDGRPLDAAASDPMGLTDEKIVEVLNAIDPDCPYPQWLSVLMAIHHETGGAGFDLVLDWCSRGSKWPSEGAGKLERRWLGFGNKIATVTIRTALKYARDAGWSGTVVNANAVQAMFPTLPPLAHLPSGPPAAAVPDYDRNPTTGRPTKTLRNVLLALEELASRGFAVAFDDFTGAPVVKLRTAAGAVVRPFEDEDYTRIRLAFMDFHDLPELPLELVKEATRLRFKEKAIDSAMDWLGGLRWDGVARIDEFMVRGFGAEDCEYSRAVSRYMWSAIAGRIIDPGCKADMMPVLVGAQGIGKSFGIFNMAPRDKYHDTYAEISFATRDDDQARIIRGVIVGEVCELNGLATKAQEAIKAFITRTHEKWVPKYREFSTAFARRMVMIGTTNEDRYLSDETGNRRYLPLNVYAVDIDYIKATRDQLYAEAAAVYMVEGVAHQKANELANTLNVRADAMLSDPWEQQIDEWFHQPCTVAGDRPIDAEFVTCKEVMERALRLNPDKMNRAVEMRVGKILRARGRVRRKKRTDENRLVWAYLKGDDGGGGGVTPD